MNYLVMDLLRPSTVGWLAAPPRKGWPEYGRLPYMPRIVTDEDGVEWEVSPGLRIMGVVEGGLSYIDVTEPLFRQLY